MVSIRLLAPAVAAAATLPAVAFYLDRGYLIVAVALVNVLLIAGSLYTMLAPEEAPAVPG
ncbi:hypothetical protein [Halorarius litoreus]|uniref:hypothetical protein n=1 Tax=Halorarius litoreus TaxID=2962676 RepID=UPI0020CCF9C1|nr:hypothetical protein [Halorarius litoreus]